MRFIKIEGIGNDFIFPEDPEDIDSPSQAARALSDRHRGVGADGLIRVLPCEDADARMEIHNADGSRAEMCGNGLRCAALFLWEFRGVRRNPARIRTDAGVRLVEILIKAGRFAGARAEIGVPRFHGPSDAEIDVPVKDAVLRGRRVSLGNPHFVVFVDAIDRPRFLEWGPAIETNPLFPDRTNVEFVRVESRRELTVRVWERGAGETLACGSGAAASLAAAVRAGRTDRSASVHLPGGTLSVDWPEGEAIRVAGPARIAFRGEVDLDRLMAETE